MNKLNIGIIGYSAQKFNESKAKKMIKKAFDILEKDNPHEDKIVISGYTDLGIPHIAYHEARKRGWSTIGVACARAKEYPCFPVDKEIIVGNEWGDESQVFLGMIDVLVRIGGGNQSIKETEMAKKMKKRVLEYEL